MKRVLLIIILTLLAAACHDPQEKAASALARRVAPQYASRIVFNHQPDTVDRFILESHGSRLIISGSSANALAAGLGRYLRDFCHADIPWERMHTISLPAKMPLPAEPVSSRALVPQRFFLNYCTFGYTMPWWKWEDWEWFIDWMALQGVNLPLATTGQEAIWQEVWRRHGLSDAQIRAWETLLLSPSDEQTWITDAVTIGSQALANHFSVLRDGFADAFRRKDLQEAERIAASMAELLDDIASLTACEPSFRLENWTEGAAGWAASREE